jgi:hypothetical protein
MIVGMVTALVLVPTAAVAAVLHFNGIQGTSNNRADVTPAQQLLATEANPTVFVLGSGRVSVVGPQGENGSYGCTVIATPPTPQAAIVRQVNVVTGVVTASNVNSASSATIVFQVSPVSAPCTGPNVAQAELVAPGQAITLALGPGVSVPAGDELDAFTTKNDACLNGCGARADVYAYGYLAPASDVGLTPR